MVGEKMKKGGVGHLFAASWHAKKHARLHKERKEARKDGRKPPNSAGTFDRTNKI
jgi:hypothetical protein